MRQCDTSFLWHNQKGRWKKSIALLLVMALMVSLPDVFAGTPVTVKAADGITPALTDLVQVKIGGETSTMQMYYKGVYEVKAALKTGETKAELLINGQKAGESTATLTADGDVYFRLANGSFTNSTEKEWVKSAALVGNFAGVEFVNTDDRAGIKLVAGDNGSKRYDIASWDPADTNAELDYIGGGIYSRTFYFQKLSADLTVADGGYKVAANDAWDVSWGDSAKNNDNIALTIPKDATELTIWVDTANGMIYDSVRSGTYSVASGGNKITLVPFENSVSLIGTVRGDEAKNWDNKAAGYEFTQISDQYYLYQQSFQAGEYAWKLVYNNNDWSDFSDIKLSVAKDDTIVYFLYDAKNDKCYDSVNNASELGTILGMSTAAAVQEVIANANDTIQFVCVPKDASSVSLTYAVYDEASKTLGQTRETALTKNTDGSFSSDAVYFGDAKTQIAYFYTIDGTRTLDSANAAKIKVGEVEYSLYEKPAFSGRKVSLPGTVNNNGWSPARESEMFTYKGNGIYELALKNIGAGNYEYKIAINGSWDENYGADAVRDGANIKLTVTKTTDITFTYNDISHKVVNSIDYIFADITLTGTGIPAGTKLGDDMLNGIYSVSLELPAGNYKDLAFHYNGKDYAVSAFEVTAAKTVSFYFDPVTELYYSDAAEAAMDESKIKYDSKDLAFKSPYGAVATGADVTFSIQTGEDVERVQLIVKGKEGKNLSLAKNGEAKDGIQTWTVKTSFAALGEYNYFFALYKGTSVRVYSDDSAKDYGTGVVTDLQQAVPYDIIVYQGGYETPDWMKNAVIYQIFPDRFYDGDPSNNQAQKTARGAVNYEYISDWSLIPENPEQETEELIGTYPDNAVKGDGEWSNEIYGGDIKGIIDRMDYLKALGVTVIYLNPVCASISSHRYDTSDYMKLDPILGDMGDFDELTRVAEENGMKVVLDGVFNHVSDDSRYFDRYYKFLEAGTDAVGAYPYWAYVYDAMAEDKSLTLEAAQQKAKKYFTDQYGITDYSYTEWFDIYTDVMDVKDTIGQRAGKPVYSYDGWWGYDSMPIIKSTDGSEYQTGTWAREIIGTEETEARDDGSVTKFWLQHGSDGWRLDVANEVSDETWQHFRKSVKALNKDNVIIGEIWTDAVQYLMGDMYDSVMNYVFRGAATAFAKKEGGSASAATAIMERLRERYPAEAFYAMMNLVASHDTTRILSYLDGIDDDRNQKDADSAFPSYAKTSDTAKNLQYVVAFIQLTYAGAPTIYYGDEIGMVGADDPDDRRAMTWGQGSKELVEWYATMAKIRSEYTALRTGSVIPFTVNDNVLAYVRSDADATLAVMANNSAQDVKASLNLKDMGLESLKVKDLVSGTEYAVTDGKAEVQVPAYRGVVLVASDKAKEIRIDTEALKPAYDPGFIVTEEGRMPEGADQTIVKKVKISSVKNVKSKKMTVTWKKLAGVDGYQILYATDKTFKTNAKKVYVKNASAVSKTIAKLKKGKTYYVKVRAYKTVNGKKVYGKYSTVKKVTIKK